MANVKVTLDIGAKTIDVDDKHVKVSVSGKTKVQWSCHEGDFQIEFKPGSDWPNPVTANNGGVWKAECGPFKAQGSLYYAVASTGYKTLDPEIVIDR
ncbi:MAG: hypothetical protein QOC81_3813 [Thermoanaerobaculia bacterium]|jgi:hypothetical protein|nr:hypothetical protein [Thermoanaerobaculia bacterium]